jgi:hypothetical protein
MTIVNWKDISTAERELTVYCGRPSVLGNPFILGRDGGRTECIDKYRRWLWERVKERNAPVMAALGLLKEDSTLGCWCSPLSCHCEVIERCWRYCRQEGLLAQRA